jgi:hypothetical protein
MNNTLNTQPQPAAPAPTRRRTWLRWILTSVIFFSGCLAGIGGTLIVIRQQTLLSIHNPETIPARVTARLRRPLSLSADQAQKIETIFRQRQQSLQHIWQKFQPEFDVELNQLEREVGQVLNEQQRSRWERVFDHVRRTWVPAPQSSGG